MQLNLMRPIMQAPSQRSVSAALGPVSSYNLCVALASRYSSFSGQPVKRQSPSDATLMTHVDCVLKAPRSAGPSVRCELRKQVGYCKTLAPPCPIVDNLAI